MDKRALEEAVERIGNMERCFDALQAAAADAKAISGDVALSDCLNLLTEYYTSGQWLRDYELDEQGLLPPDLKRGVLSQDGVYDLLDRFGGDER